MKSLCPLCGRDQATASWLGATRYAGETFEYVQCVACGSLHCEPMPTQLVSARMYGRAYCAFSDPGHEGPDDRVDEAVAAISARPQGRLIDYGCGGGDMLAAAARLGWSCLGVEFSAEVAAELTRSLGIPVVPAAELDAEMGQADVVVLNDVIEHLSDLPERFPRILELLKPGGMLVAQGPLEANASLFTQVVGLRRRVSRSAASAMPPYHLILATARGQREFFARSGLRELRFAISEVAWPAPARLTGDTVRSPRLIGLFVLRRASQAIGRAVPRYGGNRYFYAGVDV